MPVTNITTKEKVKFFKILSDLGIDMADVDNDEDYLRALMEGVNQLTIISPNDIRIPVLQGEIKRVRESRKAADPSPGMQATKKKISGASIKRGGALGVTEKKISGASIKRGGALEVADRGIGLPPLVIQSSPEPDIQQTTVIRDKGGEQSSSPKFLQGLIKILKGILDNVNGMLAVLSGQQLFEKRRARQERKKAEKAARTTREDKLEDEKDRFAGLKKMGEKIISPVIGLWGRLWDFLTTIFLGRLAMKIWDWLSDPENQKKLERIAQSIAEWWPGFIKGTTEFFTEVGNFAKWVVDNIGAWTTTLITTTIPALTAALIGMGPWGVAGAATAGLAGGLIWNQTQKSDDKGSPKTVPASPTTTEQTDETTEQTDETIIQDSSDKIDPFEVLEKNRDLVPFGMYGRALEVIKKDPSAYDTREEIEAALSRLGIDAGRIKYAEGGQVPGRGDKDTVPAMLTPGEFVMSKGAVEKYGADVLASMNAMGGGTNIPLIGGLSGLGGGGGGTDALTEQAKVKTFASAILDFFMGDDGKRRRERKFNDSEQFLNGGGLVGLSHLSPEARAWLGAINAVEAGGPDKFHRLVGTEVVPELTKMTIQEVYDMAYSREIGKGNLPARFGGREVTYGASSHAAGAYQFHPDTMLSAAETGNLSRDTLYTPTTQHLLALAWAKRLGIDTNKPMDPASLAIAGSTGGWEGLSVPKGKITQAEALSLYNKMLQREKKSPGSAIPSASAGFTPIARSGTKTSSSKEGTRSAYESLFDSGHTPNTAQITADLMSGFTFSDLISKIDKPKPPVVNPPSTPKSTVVYEREMAQQIDSGMPGSTMSLPTLDPAAMISAPKIQTLGISI